MKPELKKQKAVEKLAEMIKAAGIEIPIPAAHDLPQNQSTGIDPSLEAESVLSFIKNPSLFETKLCEQCRKPFATNNKPPVSCCSDACRAIKLQKIGISWDPSKNPDERFGFFGQPLVIPAYFLSQLFERMQELNDETPTQVHHEEEVVPHQTIPQVPLPQPKIDELGLEVFSFED